MASSSTFLKSDFLSRHETEIWTQFIAQSLPLDRFLANYYRNHRYLGAKDRRHLSAILYKKCRELPWPPVLAPYHTPVYDGEAPLVIRANRLKTTRDVLIDRLAQEGIESTPTSICPDGLILSRRLDLRQSPAFNDGLFEVQDEGSQLVGELIHPQPHTIILDACAGAGGKTLHLAALLQNQGMILATDKDPKRLHELHKRQLRAGVRNIQIYGPHDVSPLGHSRESGNPEMHMDPRFRGDDHFRDSLNSFHKRCDTVLIDVPCSGTGTIRRNPDLKIRFQADQISTYTTMQQEVLTTFSSFVRPGGSLYYVTCSFLPEENEDMIHWFLTHHPQFSISSIQCPPTMSASIFDAIQTPKGFVRTHRLDHPWDGFFIAKLHIPLLQAAHVTTSDYYVP